MFVWLRGKGGRVAYLVPLWSGCLVGCGESCWGDMPVETVVKVRAKSVSLGAGIDALPIGATLAAELAVQPMVCLPSYVCAREAGDTPVCR